MNKLIVDSKSDIRRQFYIDNENRLVLNRDKDIKIVMENVSGGFDGVFDFAGNLYIVCATEGGGIECLVCDESGEKNFTLVSAKNGKSKISNIRLFCINSIFSLWYCLEYDGSSLLVNQFFDSSGRAEAPFAVDTLGYKKCFSICCDSNFDTHVFYVDNDEKSRYLIYRWNRKKFEPKDRAFFDFDDVVSISSICDGKDIHTAFVAKRNDYYGVYYKKIGSFDESVLGFGVGAGCATSVIAFGEGISVYWCDNFESCECKSVDFGKSFDKPKRINAIGGGKNVFCRYRAKDNGLCMYVNQCILGANGKILHEKDIVNSIIGKKGDNDLKREIINYSKENMSDVLVGMDIASKIESIETCLMKIVCILQEFAFDKEQKSTPKSSDIGETYTENIELFNNINIEKI